MKPLPDLGEGAEPKPEYVNRFMLTLDLRTFNDAITLAALHQCEVNNLIVEALHQVPEAAKWIAGLTPRMENPITINARVLKSSYAPAAEAVQATGRRATLGDVLTAILHQNVSGAIHAAGEDGILVGNFFAELRDAIQRVNGGQLRVDDLERRFSAEAVSRYNAAMGETLQDRHLVRGRIGGYVERTGPAPESGHEITARIIAERNREAEADARRALALLGA